MGVQQDYFSIAGLTIKKGRGITDEDNKKFRQVAVLDETSARLLFGEDHRNFFNTIHHCWCLCR